jgi:hypothetical protein
MHVRSGGAESKAMVAKLKHPAPVASPLQGSEISQIHQGPEVLHLRTRSNKNIHEFFTQNAISTGRLGHSTSTENVVIPAFCLKSVPS